ncbi:MULTISPECIES: endo alpha-1,4 polygalactosaminidase [Methylobacterium]|uniref:endo alpha-1,4 polygalactosaminidase n=1 Tax=Methylobacterium TaxID=407 RepID=UPI0013EC764F|nr:endo alpha-1,4 polygalactosaminidase [Methylobacterium sp. DB0501]NGM38947.1 hypothetical protein [Methylobacterium sp. DB0501]
MKTGMYVLQGVDPAQVAAAPFDVKVVEIYDDTGRLFDPTQVKQMGGGPGAALLLGYFSIGEAEQYRSYWPTIPRSAIGPEDPNWKGNYEVKYWTDDWKAVAQAEIDKMISAGYDGAYFDVVDEFQLPWAERNAPGGDAAAAMKSLVEHLSDYAKSKAPTFKIWVNGGEELLTDPKYLASIDGLFKENLFYNSDGSAAQPEAETRSALDALKLAQAAGKDVVAIEYVNGAARIADVQAKADAAGMGSYIARLDLKGVSLDGVRPGQTMHDDGLAGPAAPPSNAPAGGPAPLTPEPKPAEGASGGEPPAPLAALDVVGAPGGSGLPSLGEPRSSDVALVTGLDPTTDAPALDPAALLHGDPDAARIPDIADGAAGPALTGQDGPGA